MTAHLLAVNISQHHHGILGLLPKAPQSFLVFKIPVAPVLSTTATTSQSVMNEAHLQLLLACDMVAHLVNNVASVV